MSSDAARPARSALYPLAPGGVGTSKVLRVTETELVDEIRSVLQGAGLLD